MRFADPSSVRRQAAATAAAVFDRLLASVDDDLRPRWRVDRARVKDSEDETILLEADPGAVADGRIWLHNTSRTELVGVRLFVTELAGTGGRLDGSTATVWPSPVDVAANDSASVAIQVPIPPQTPPGVYLGRVRCWHPPADVAVRLVVPE
jgi:hypothetical protein